ncbi:hypothetical protein J2Z32_003754 [Paenibacillus turicensis]|uniref:Uncharacterized protein n=1 Tax=Paenibacillus turicensis TaxID=160487 RepID=A0ABS4FX39_9BACL|nr:hypothetical protein [Paenibacillus turicensis]MBP1907089.1 hypothetical protein [Paenibacillus turicensis]
MVNDEDSTARETVDVNEPAPLIIDELSEWTRERYEIKPIIISRSEAVKLVVNDKECSAASIIALAVEQLRVHPSAFNRT